MTGRERGKKGGGAGQKWVAAGGYSKYSTRYAKQQSFTEWQLQKQGEGVTDVRTKREQLQERFKSLMVQ